MVEHLRSDKRSYVVGYACMRHSWRRKKGRAKQQLIYFLVSTSYFYVYVERTPIEIVNFLFLPEIDGPGHLSVFIELLKNV